MSALVERKPDGPVGSSEPGTGPLLIAGRSFSSRLFVGTGKYKSMEWMRNALQASGSEVVSQWARALTRAAISSGTGAIAMISSDPSS